MRWRSVRLGVIILSVIGIACCVFGAVLNRAEFAHAWLCAYVFWLGLPLAGTTLVLVHDLSGGAWMGTARPSLAAAALTMPIASLAAIPAFVELRSLYSWTTPADLTNVFYLNPAAFYIRYAIDLLLWNGLAAYAVWGPREGKAPIAPGLSWISGIGLVVLAFSAGFAAIDWILSLEPKFWSSIFPYTQSASWFNTGMAVIVLAIAVSNWPAAERRDHMSDLARILLSTTIFWAYVQFMEILIIWEENLKTEIPWYLKRIHSEWAPAIYVSAGLGFVVPFCVLLWRSSKYRGPVVATVCALILISRIANTWVLIMPEFEGATPLWLAVAALIALGGPILLIFEAGLRRRRQRPARRGLAWSAAHG